MKNINEENKKDNKIKLEKEAIEEENKASMDSMEVSEIVGMLNGFDDIEIIGIKAVAYLFHILSSKPFFFGQNEDAYIEEMSNIGIPINSIEDYLDSAIMSFFMLKNKTNDIVKAVEYADNSVKKILMSGFFMGFIKRQDESKQTKAEKDRLVYISPYEYKMGIKAGLFKTKYFINDFKVSNFSFVNAELNTSEQSVIFNMKPSSGKDNLTFKTTLSNLLNIFVDYEFNKDYFSLIDKNEALGAYALLQLTGIINTLSSLVNIDLDKEKIKEIKENGIEEMDLDIESSVLKKIATDDESDEYEKFKEENNKEINSLLL